MSKSNDIAKQMQEILDGIVEGVDDAVDAALNKVPKGAASELRQTSPKEHGEYQRGWTVKRLDKKTVAVYNKAQPGLTHLLENGHIGKNQYGQYTRVRAIKHIEPANDKYTEEFYERIVEGINKL